MLTASWYHLQSTISGPQSFGLAFKKKEKKKKNTVRGGCEKDLEK